jgi:hypothetical protein
MSTTTAQTGANTPRAMAAASMTVMGRLTVRVPEPTDPGANGVSCEGGDAIGKLSCTKFN